MSTRQNTSHLIRLHIILEFKILPLNGNFFNYVNYILSDSSVENSCEKKTYFTHINTTDKID